MHIPFVEILFFLAVALAPGGTNEIQITGPRFSAHWILTPEGWRGGQYDQALWKLKTRPEPPEEENPTVKLMRLMENTDWTRAVVVEGGRFAGLFPVSGYVEPALGRNWKVGMKVDFFRRETLEKTAAGFVYTTLGAGGLDRKYEISYNNDGSPYTDTEIFGYESFLGADSTELREVGMRVKEKRADQLPRWTSQDNTPIPVSIGRALELVRQACKKMPVPPRIANIRLGHRVPDNDARDFYYYDLEVDFPDPQPFGTTPHIVVLLDGTVLFPEPKPWQDL